ncbi:MAG: hypothetical protein U0800_09815 [Isosphaeraceae bacterium]
MGAEWQGRRIPIRILAIAGLLLLAFGGWRLATRFSGHPERYFWADVKELEDHLQEVTKALEKTRYDLEDQGGTLTREMRISKEGNQKSEEQLERDLTKMIAARIDAAASQELRLGFFATVLGLACLGSAAYLRFRRP